MTVLDDDDETAPNPDAERVNDLAKRLLHRLVARRLPREPELLDRARARFAGRGDGRQQPDYVAEWRALLDLPVGELRRRITARGEVMDRLRSSSPFFGGGDYADVDLRRRIWRAARRIAMDANNPRPIQRTRAEAVLYAIASTEIEGGRVTPEMRALFGRWVAGELDDDGLLAAVLTLCADGGSATRNDDGDPR